MRGGKLQMSLSSTIAVTNWPFQLSCQLVNIADRINAPSKCELCSFTRFIQAKGWFVENDQCSCFLSDLTTTTKSHSDFWSCLIHDKARPHSAVVN
ncbi:hypothetical protein AVEN_10999-1 [Araneus ventricosus]|uniref:Uncharacterized protein n=1 Tax=Araneus ventricosus TaxID=182803 RepID=A0A4Y2P0L7_ARAVE|nr:hypothetical protein AVEN_10999-1 [Araneus ventricosus]